MEAGLFFFVSFRFCAGESGWSAAAHAFAKRSQRPLWPSSGTGAPGCSTSPLTGSLTDAYA
jgi:hypothetical protein